MRKPREIDICAKLFTTKCTCVWLGPVTGSNWFLNQWILVPNTKRIQFEYKVCEPMPQTSAILHMNQGITNDHDSIDIAHEQFFFAEVLPQYGKANKLKQLEIVCLCVRGVQHMGVNGLGYEIDVLTNMFGVSVFNRVMRCVPMFYIRSTS